jgi:hypothetical protein
MFINNGPGTNHTINKWPLQLSSYDNVRPPNYNIYGEQSMYVLITFVHKNMYIHVGR